MSDAQDTDTGVVFPPQEVVPNPSTEVSVEAGGAEADHDAAQESLEDVFFRWFQRFNDHDREAKASPAEGAVSLKCAVEQVREQLVMGEMEAVRFVDRHAPARTRHMHARPSEIGPGWSEHCVVDTEHWRLRQPHIPDNPQHWFALELHAGVLAASIEHERERREQELRAEQRELTEEEERYEAPRMPRYVEPSPRAQLDLTGFPVADASALQMAHECMPRDYALELTPDGFVAVWRSEPVKRARDAVEAAWAQATGRGPLPRK